MIAWELSIDGQQCRNCFMNQASNMYSCGLIYVFRSVWLLIKLGCNVYDTGSI